MAEQFGLEGVARSRSRVERAAHQLDERARACALRVKKCFLGARAVRRRKTQADEFVVRRKLVDRKSTRLNSSHANISYAVFCLKKKNPISLSSRITTTVN